MASLTLYPATLRWALEESEVDSEAVSFNKDLSQLPDWLDSQVPVAVPFTKVEKLSRVLQIPLGALVRSVVPKPRQESLVQYRTIGNKTVRPSHNLQDTIDQMRMRQDWARDTMLDSGLGKNSVVGSISKSANSEQLARGLRKVLGLESDWAESPGDDRSHFRDIKQRASDAGIMVMLNSQVGYANNRKLDTREFRAFVLVDDVAPLVFINRNDSYRGMLFSLFHEIGHVLLGFNELFNDIDHVGDYQVFERLINRAVLKTVVDEEDFKRLWKEYANQDVRPVDIVDRMAERYHLSALSLGIQAKTLGLTGQKTVDELRTLMEDHLRDYRLRTDENKSERGNPHLTNASRLDPGFVRLVKRSMDSGSLGSTEGFDLLGIKSVKAYEGLIKQEGLR